MPELLAILDDIWMRNGPLLNYHYPHARPIYPGMHEHERVLENLRRRDAVGVRASIQTDMLQGGANLVKLLEAAGNTSNLSREQPAP